MRIEVNGVRLFFDLERRRIMAVTAFRDVTVVPMDGDRLLPHHTVIVRGDRIERVGPSAQTVVPPGAVVVDGSGRYLMPGLVDMHVHFFDNSRRYGLLFIANGVTTVRNMFGTAMHLEMRAAAASASRPSPTIYTTGPLMDGNPPVSTNSAVAVIETREHAEASVAQQKTDGYDFLKIYTRLSLAAFDAVAAAGKRHGLRVVGHLPEGVPIVHAVRAGLASLEHVYSYLTALQADDSPYRAGVYDRQMFNHIDEAKIPEITELVQDAGAWSCPTLVVNEKAALAGAFDEQVRRPEMQYLSPAVIAYWRGLSSQFRFTAEAIPLFERALDVQRSVVAGLHAAGARLLLGTDSNMPLVTWGFSIHDELRLFVDAGLSPYEAIRAGTNNAAEFLHASDEFGRVAEGLRADMILLEADPLEDVANVNRRAGVMLRGRWLPEVELQRMLKENVEASDPNANYSFMGYQPDTTE